MQQQLLDPKQRLFDIAAAARYLGLTETAVRARIFRGQIPTTKIGHRSMIERVELERLIERGQDRR